MCKENNKVTKLTTFALIRCFYLTFEQVWIQCWCDWIYFLDLRNEGPMKYHPSICMFVYLSVFLFGRLSGVFFLELLLETSIFLDQIRLPSIARFFWKNFILGLSSQSVPKLAINKVLQVLKIDAWSLSDFSHEVINNLFGKILVSRF